MASIAVAAGSAACCCAGQVCCACCHDLFKSFGLLERQQAKFGYIISFAVTAGFSLLFMYHGPNMLTHASGFSNCSSTGEFWDFNNDCVGLSLAFRLSFSLLMLHAFIFVCSLCQNKLSVIIHEACWVVKTVFLVAMLIGTFFMDHEVFNGYEDFARIFSVIFLLVQGILLIDFGYSWNDSWLQKYADSEESSCMACLFFGTTVVLLAGIGLIVAYTFVWFTDGDDCGTEMAIAVVSVILAVIAIGLSIAGLSENGSLLTSTFIGLYGTFLAWSGLANRPGECNTISGDPATTSMQIVGGILFLVICLIYISFSHQTTEHTEKSGLASVTAPLKDDNSEETSSAPKQNQGDYKKHENFREEYEDDPEYNKNITVFHLVMMVIVIYMAMVITNWGYPVRSEGEEVAAGSDTVFWVKISAQWVTYILFFWTLIAPSVCSGRDFE